MAIDTSRDGLSNKILTYALSNFKPTLVARVIGIDAFSQIGWNIIQNTKTLADLVNRNVPASDSQYKVIFNR